LPIPREPLAIQGVLLSVDKLVAAGIALLCIALVSWGFQHSRIGVALRALADDQQAAMLVGIDLNRYCAMTWALLGILCVVAGTLWTFMSGGGFGVVLVGLKVFPIVIIGGLDSIPGTLLGALVVGLLESLAAGYLDPLLGGGFSTIAAYLVALVVLFMRPYGLFGKPDIERV
jgi:branched-chain amino acid transport system permease protein